MEVVDTSPGGSPGDTSSVGSRSTVSTPSHIRSFLHKANLLQEDRDAVVTAVRRVSAMTVQGKLGAPSEELILNEVVLGLSEPARRTVLSGTDEQVVQLGRDLARMQQLLDMLDGNHRRGIVKATTAAGGGGGGRGQGIIRHPERRRVRPPPEKEEAASVSRSASMATASPISELLMGGAPCFRVTAGNVSQGGGSGPADSSVSSSISSISASTSSTISDKPSDDSSSTTSAAGCHGPPLAVSPPPPSWRGRSVDAGGDSPSMLAFRRAASKHIHFASPPGRPPMPRCAPPPIPTFPPPPPSAAGQDSSTRFANSQLHLVSPHQQAADGAPTTTASSSSSAATGFSPSSSVSSLTLSSSPSCGSKTPAAADDSSGSKSHATTMGGGPVVSPRPTFWGFLEELTRRPEASRQQHQDAEDGEADVEWESIYDSPGPRADGEGSGGPQVSSPLRPPEHTAPVSPVVRSEEVEMDAGWWAKRSAVLDSSSKTHKLNITSPPRRKTSTTSGRAAVTTADPHDSSSVSQLPKGPRSILKRAGTTSPATPGRKHHASFSTVTMRFYGYAIGGSVPSSQGPAIGFGWHHEEHGVLECSVDAYETFRGVIWDEEEMVEGEEWDPNWRIPCKYFGGEDGRIPAQRRVELLVQAGHRRLSIDLNCHELARLRASRQVNGRSKASYLVLKGADPEQAMAAECQAEAVLKIGAWLTPYIVLWKQGKAASSSSTSSSTMHVHQPRQS